MTYYGRWKYKLEEAKRQGAAGALVLHNTPAASYGWNVCCSSHLQNNIGLCDDDLNKDALAFQGWLHEEAAKKLFTISGLDFEEVTAAAKKPGFKSFAMKAKSKVSMNVKVNVGESHNVAGILPGTDLKDEYIVCTAHWDHFGIGQAIDGDSIYNGAADNASGTAALMLLAKKYQELPVKPRRSIVFVAVTSEECGLLGSQHYCENPLFPLSKTAVNLNFDGSAPAARTTGVTLRAAGKSDTDALVVAVAAAQGRKVHIVTEDPAGGYFRADHFNFVKKGVPTVLAGGGGEVIDKARQAAKPKRYTYHQPNDEYREDEWDFDGAMENLNLMFSIGLLIANQDEMPKWTKDADFQRQ
jgi:Zn-dependent M28 family amino/carboxypeptidase